MPLNYEEYKRKYAQQEDELEAEIEDAEEQREEREQREPENSFEVPERFKDKGVEDIIRSYTELEKAFSRQGNQLGEYRKLTEQLLELESAKGASQRDSSTPEDDSPISIDDLYDNPEAAISRAVEKTAGEKIAKLERELAEARAKTVEQQLSERYQGWRDEVSTPEFSNWLHDWASTQYRQALAVAADQGDPAALEEVLASYYERKATAERREENKEQKREQRRKQVQQGSLESGGAEHTETEERFSRKQLLELRINAKRGDAKAREYLAANADAIAAAYAEGRLVD